MSAKDRGRALMRLESSERYAFLSELDPQERALLKRFWPMWARDEQMPPSDDWRTWVICAGRGFGKTRAGAEWVRCMARANDDARIALIAGSIGEARSVMVEGESGILACCGGDDDFPLFEPSLRKLSWQSGAIATIYSAGEPESLRGPQHSHAWCDEIAKWDNSSERAMTAWDNMQMGLRLGEKPQVLATTTPRAVPLMRRLMEEGDPDVAVTKGSTYDNVHHLPAEFIKSMKRQYGRTALGRQELDGELLGDVEGALWTRSMIEQCREPLYLEGHARVVVGVDPPASARGDECGIVVVGLGHDGKARVMADASLARPSPERWARAVASTARDWKADRVVAEANQGGDMVESVLRAADCQMPIRLVHASRGKAARAEPVAALYETGRVAHVGQFARLEDQLCGIMAGGGYEGPGRSPDRADALVWALWELMLGRGGMQPRVKVF